MTNSMQLVSGALNNLVHRAEIDHHSLISRIAALHLVYETHKSHILWFGQLITHFPSIMESLTRVLPATYAPEMVI